MKCEHGFSQTRRNANATRLRHCLTCGSTPPAIAAFKELTAKTAIPYQTRIHLYLRGLRDDRPEDWTCTGSDAPKALPNLRLQLSGAAE